MLKRILVILAALLGITYLAAPGAAAHSWCPADNCNGHVTTIQTDDCSHESEWQMDDGEVEWHVSWYNHAGHVHMDHVATTFHQNWSNCNGNDHIYRIDNQHLRIFGGVCGTTFPDCKTTTLGPKLYDSYMPDSTHAGDLTYENIADRYEYYNVFLVIDYQVRYQANNCCDLSFAGEEEIQLDG